jgi:hypothetical protein
MRTRQVTYRPLILTKRQLVAEPPAGEVLEGDVLLLAGRRVVGMQLRLGDRAAAWPALRAALDGLATWDGPSKLPQPGGVGGAARLSGIQSRNRTFGWLPPQPLRRRYGAMAASLDLEQPALAEMLHDLGGTAWAATETHLGQAAQVHLKEIRQIPPCWHYGGPWTSGVINRNSALPYHRDAGNLLGCISAMVALRSGVEGGALHLAEYDTWLAVPDRSLIVFSGSSITHGVSPLEVNPGGRRYTLVWYVRARFRDCADTIAGELARSQLVATSHDEVPDGGPA